MRARFTLALGLGAILVAGFVGRPRAADGPYAKIGEIPIGGADRMVRIGQVLDCAAEHVRGERFVAVEFIAPAGRQGFRSQVQHAASYRGTTRGAF